MSTATMEKRKNNHILNTSLSRSAIKNQHLDAAVEMVQVCGDLHFTKSELVTRCIEESFAKILANRGLSDEQIGKILNEV